MAKKRKKQLTPMQQLYKKELNRINRFIQRASKREYFFKNPLNLSMPKRVTKQALEAIQRLDADRLYAKMWKVDESTGELIHGERARTMERKKAAKKAADTRFINKFRSTRNYIELPDDPAIRQNVYDNIVISEYREDISGLSWKGFGFISEWINKLIKLYGLHYVATMVAEGKKRERLIAYKESYDESKLSAYCSRMRKYLPEVGPFTANAFEKVFGDEEDWPDI